MLRRRDNYSHTEAAAEAEIQGRFEETEQIFYHLSYNNPKFYVNEHPQAD